MCDQVATIRLVAIGRSAIASSDSCEEHIEEVRQEFQACIERAEKIMGNTLYPTVSMMGYGLIETQRLQSWVLENMMDNLQFATSLLLLALLVLWMLLDSALNRVEKSIKETVRAVARDETEKILKSLFWLKYDSLSEQEREALWIKWSYVHLRDRRWNHAFMDNSGRSVG
jgi:hypothetical protein